MTCLMTRDSIPLRSVGFTRAVLIVASTFLARDALADVSATNRAVARSLFEQGRDLMKQKRYPEACPKFSESQRLDPAGGTLLNLAVCHEAEGKTATAWTEFNDAAMQARVEHRENREKFANDHIAYLAPKLSRLTVSLAPGAEISGLLVKLDPQ